MQILHLDVNTFKRIEMFIFSARKDVCKVWAAYDTLLNISSFLLLQRNMWLHFWMPCFILLPCRDIIPRYSFLNLGGLLYVLKDVVSLIAFGTSCISITNIMHMKKKTVTPIILFISIMTCIHTSFIAQLWFIFSFNFDILQKRNSGDGCGNFF